MKANELRLGNYVYEEVLGNSRVVQIGSDEDIWVETDNIEENGNSNKRCFHLSKGNYNPIPLTEEWLLKFGFTKLNWGADLKYRLNEVEIFNVDNGWRLNIPYHITICKYVYQLQNLYFALIGEELKTKE